MIILHANKEYQGLHCLLNTFKIMSCFIVVGFFWMIMNFFHNKNWFVFAVVFMRFKESRVYPGGIFSAVCSCIAVCHGFVLNRNSVSFIIPKFCEISEEIILWKVIVYRNMGSEWWMVYCHGINKQTQKQLFNWPVWEVTTWPLVSSSALHLPPCWKSLKNFFILK